MKNICIKEPIFIEIIEEKVNIDKFLKIDGQNIMFKRFL